MSGITEEEPLEDESSKSTAGQYDADQKQLLSVEETDNPTKIKALEAYLRSLVVYNNSWTEDPLTFNPDMTLENEELVRVSRVESHTKDSNGNNEEVSSDCSPNCPIKIAQNEHLGRHLVAPRHIKAGEVVLIEPPYVIGPMGSSPKCLYCLSTMEKNEFSCPDCGFYFCDSKCLTSEHAVECADLKLLGLSDNNFTPKGVSFANKLRAKRKSEKDTSSDETDLKVQKLRTFMAKASAVLQSRKMHIVQKYLAVTTLRTLRDMEQNPQKCATIMSMQANVVTDSPQYIAHNKSMIIPIVSKVRPKVHPDLLQRIAAVWDTNCFEVYLGSGNKVQGMYPLASLINHACRANMQQSYSLSGAMIIRAIDDIPEGSPLSIWYMNPLWPTRMRRKHLSETKHFECCCERCTDPSELGSFMGSSLCDTCKSVMLPDDPLDEDTAWHCSNPSCEHILTKLNVRALDAKMATVLLKVTGKNLDVLRDIVEGMLENFHPHHHLIVRLHLACILHYSTLDIADCSDDHLGILVNSSKEVLEVLTAIEGRLATKKARVSREYVRCRLEQLKRIRDKDEDVDISDELKELQSEIDSTTLCLSWCNRAPSMKKIHVLYEQLHLKSAPKS